MALELNLGNKWLEASFTGANPTFYMRRFSLSLISWSTDVNEYSLSDLKNLLPILSVLCYTGPKA